ncbi:MAG: peptidyl-prolyl cis-trans isomerase, cyclophilin-type [Cyanobacteria bacterium RYN_339]|nr:peptidyl-prolyl cis-trans isomerase, cyclophilin-type [Cyanobacteria bacterium RYN_339]
MIRRLAAAAVTLLVLSAPAFAMGQRPQEPPTKPEAHPASSIADMEEAAGHLLILGPKITFETSKGKFTVVTFPKEAPRTVDQVVKLVEAGFYDNIQFHRVVPGFAVQAGDPASKTLAATDPKVGKGGSGQPLPPEYEGQTVKQLLGTLAMARAVKDPNSADSQFYVTLAPQPHLDGAFTVWAQVVNGMDVVRGLAVGDRITKAGLVPPEQPAK